MVASAEPRRISSPIFRIRVEAYSKRISPRSPSLELGLSDRASTLGFLERVGPRTHLSSFGRVSFSPRAEGNKDLLGGNRPAIVAGGEDSWLSAVECSRTRRDLTIEGAWRARGIYNCHRRLGMGMAGWTCLNSDLGGGKQITNFDK